MVLQFLETGLMTLQEGGRFTVSDTSLTELFQKNPINVEAGSLDPALWRD
jgi:hypothetical protein